MNLNSNYSVKVLSIGLAFGATLIAVAQLAPVAASNRPPSAVDTPGLRPGSGPLRRGPADEGLGQEQSRAIRQAMESTREETRVLSEKLRLARKELEQAVHAEKIDEELIRAKAMEVGKVEGDMAVLRARTYAKIRPFLKPGQTEQIKQGEPAEDRLRNRLLPGQPENGLSPRRGSPLSPRPAVEPQPPPPGRGPATNGPPRPASSPAPN
ncbi:MAG: periplasmic heavy metal sensor [Chloroflexi bacterium]|nr:periplasmic heavy metal sensor [Chloroflexota bacterium]